MIRLRRSFFMLRDGKPPLCLPLMRFARGRKNRSESQGEKESRRLKAGGCRFYFIF
jgi:hypothetical protein